MGCLRRARAVGETGVSATFHAVLEPYAGKARTYGSSGAAFPQGNVATQFVGRDVRDIATPGLIGRRDGEVLLQHVRCDGQIVP